MQNYRSVSGSSTGADIGTYVDRSGDVDSPVRESPPAPVRSRKRKRSIAINRKVGVASIPSNHESPIIPGRAQSITGGSDNSCLAPNSSVVTEDGSVQIDIGHVRTEDETARLEGDLKRIHEIHEELGYNDPPARAREDDGGNVAQADSTGVDPPVIFPWPKLLSWKKILLCIVLAVVGEFLIAKKNFNALMTKSFIVFLWFIILAIPWGYRRKRRPDIEMGGVGNNADDGAQAQESRLKTATLITAEAAVIIIYICARLVELYFYVTGNIPLWGVIVTFIVEIGVVCYPGLRDISSKVRTFGCLG